MCIRDSPIGDSVAGNRKIDGSGRLFDGNFDGIVGDQHAVHIHKPCRRRKIDRIDGGSLDVYKRQSLASGCRFRHLDRIGGRIASGERAFVGGTQALPVCLLYTSRCV